MKNLSPFLSDRRLACDDESQRELFGAQSSEFSMIGVTSQEVTSAFSLASVSKKEEEEEKNDD